MSLSSLHHKLIEIFLICVLPTIRLLVLVSLLIGSLVLCFFANELLNFDVDLDDSPPLSIPVVVITPPTEGHVTNLPPPFEEQDPNFLRSIRRPRRIHRRTGSSKSKARSLNKRRGARWISLLNDFFRYTLS
ncbi:secreted protein [Melampsora americana]|nr:secreted protein [Melampsora americana]